MSMLTKTVPNYEYCVCITISYSLVYEVSRIAKLVEVGNIIPQS
jgi:hypothetical protein